MVQSEELTKFYQAYNDWLERGAPNNKPFSHKQALCGSLERFYEKLPPVEKLNLVSELRCQLEDAGLDTRLPFDKNWVSFHLSYQNSRLHLNPKRVAWVKEHLNNE
jgi:hypothetical protein